MAEIWTMGEMLVEIMRSKVDIPFDQTGDFLGPFPSGAPAIFIDAVAKLGNKAGIIGAVGDDGFGANLKNRLVEDGVDCKYVKILEGSTAVAFITYYSNKSREYIFHINDTPAVKIKKPRDPDVDSTGYFHLMGCSLFMNPDFCHEIMSTLYAFVEKGYKISFDPNIRTELLKGDDFASTIAPVMANCTVLLPGEQELYTVSGETDIESAARSLFATYAKLEVIAVKLGSKGCRIITREDDLFIDAIKIKEVDPTGAGDCFDAGFLVGLINGKSLRDSAAIASAAGAINASAFGPMEGELSLHNIQKILQGTAYEQVKL